MTYPSQYSGGQVADLCSGGCQGYLVLHHVLVALLTPLWRLAGCLQIFTFTCGPGSALWVIRVSSPLGLARSSSMLHRYEGAAAKTVVQSNCTAKLAVLQGVTIKLPADRSLPVCKVLQLLVARMISTIGDDSDE